MGKAYWMGPARDERILLIAPSAINCILTLNCVINA
jgi:hypothetical protein